MFSPSRDQEFVIRLTPNGRILDCDERIKGLLELVPQEVIGTSIYDHLHRNDIPRIVEVLEKKYKLVASKFKGWVYCVKAYRTVLIKNTFCFQTLGKTPINFEKLKE